MWQVHPGSFLVMYVHHYLYISPSTGQSWVRIVTLVSPLPWEGMVTRPASSPPSPTPNSWSLVVGTKATRLSMMPGYLMSTGALGRRYCHSLQVCVCIVCSIITVEPHLTDTPQQRIQYLKVLTVLPFTSILNQSLNSGHPTTLYNRQFSWSQLHVYANKT